MNKNNGERIGADKFDKSLCSFWGNEEFMDIASKAFMRVQLYDTKALEMLETLDFSVIDEELLPNLIKFSPLTLDFIPCDLKYTREVLDYAYDLYYDGADYLVSDSSSDDIESWLRLSDYIHSDEINYPEAFDPDVSRDYECGLISFSDPADHGSKRLSMVGKSTN